MTPSHANRTPATVPNDTPPVPPVTLRPVAGPAPKPTKRQWLESWLDGMAADAHTGKVVVEIHFNRGGITRLVPMVEASTD